MTLNDFVLKTHLDNDYLIRPSIVCNDGFTMSVQGSNRHYCSPRNLSKHYLKMEIGFPSEQEDLIMQFVEDKSNPTEQVYGYVPCEIIQNVIDKHNGINIEKTFI